MKVTGKVLWWDARDKEGVIEDSNGNEYYFNASVFEGHERIRKVEGRLVEFVVNSTISHILCASKVAIALSSSQSKSKKTIKKHFKSRNSEAAV